MTVTSRYYLLEGRVPDEYAEEMQDELNREFLTVGVTVDAYPGVGRMVLVTPASCSGEVVTRILDDMGHKVTHHWPAGEPGGRSLSVNLEYADTKEVVSASLNEGLLAQALSGLHAQGVSSATALAAAVTALAGDNEFPEGYSPMDRTLGVRDVMVSVEFWNESEAVKWSPFGWDPDEPMLEIGFTPEADMVGQSSIIPVHVDGMPSSWKMPLRLLPEVVDPYDPDSLDKLALLPCAPEKVRLWASMMPFTVVIENPEIIPAPDNGPGF